MPNRILTEDERKELFLPFIDEVRRRLEELSEGNQDLLWALRRKLYKTLTYDERDKPHKQANPEAGEKSNSTKHVRYLREKPS